MPYELRRMAGLAEVAIPLCARRSLWMGIGAKKIARAGPQAGSTTSCQRKDRWLGEPGRCPGLLPSLDLSRFFSGSDTEGKVSGLGYFIEGYDKFNLLIINDFVC